MHQNVLGISSHRDSFFMQNVGQLSNDSDRIFHLTVLAHTLLLFLIATYGNIFAFVFTY